MSNQISFGRRGRGIGLALLFGWGLALVPGAGHAQDGVAQTSEAAVPANLLWLARHQDEDGHWDAARFAEHCTGQPCGGAGNAEHNVGLTGLSLLAFLGAGYTHLSREKHTDPVSGKEVVFGQVVKAAVKYLIVQSQADGRLGPDEGARPLMNHTVATLALSEAFGLTQSRLFQDPAQKAIDCLVRAQNPGAGWGDRPLDGKSNTLLTCLGVMALTSARISGLECPEGALADARRFIESVTEPTYGKCGYRRDDPLILSLHDHADYVPHESLSAMGMLCRMFSDRDAKDPKLRLGANLLVPDAPTWDAARRTIDYGYWYFGTLALFQFDGPTSSGVQGQWQPWGKSVAEALTGHQARRADGCACGSWDPVDRWSGPEGGGGRVFATALNTLTLEVYYRYESVVGGGRRR